MKRALVAVLPVALALGLVACGDDDDAPDSVPASTPATVDEATGGDVTLPGGGTLPDISMPDITLPGGSTLPDLSDITMPDLSDLSIPDFSIPDVSLPSGMIEQLLRSTLPNLSDDQIDCLVDGLGGSLDLQQLPDLAQDCNIDASDLTPGG